MFPPLPSTVQQAVADTSIVHQCPPLPNTPSNITTSSLIRAAWAIVTSRYTNSDDVVFGATVTGRNAPVAGIETIVGTTIATLPIRLRVSGKQMLASFLQAVQQQSTEMIPYEQTGLQRISKLGPSAQHACSFQTLLLVQPPADDIPDVRKDLGEWRIKSEIQDFTTYGLMLQCALTSKGVQITASFDQRVMERHQVQRLLSQLSFVMQQLAEAPADMLVSDIDVITPDDKTQLWMWNGSTPQTVDRCIHDLVAEQSALHPDAQAVCAWDGSITYGEMEAASTALACHLVGLGVGPEQIVPLCFEKSLWMVVSMLAVLKAGGAFAPLDPEHPRSRQDEIINQTNAKVIVTSAKYAALWDEGRYAVVAVGRSLLERLSTQSSLQTSDAALRPTAHPHNMAYVIPTSGSTGVPKLVVIEHSAASTAFLEHGKAFGYQQDTRVLQFAGYTVDSCMDEILAILICAGSICIPSEEDRRDNLVRFINETRVNWAFLTPSVARLLDPATVPTLASLEIGGEQVTSADWDQWKDHVRVINGYGPAECCVCCCTFADADGFETGKIGKAIGSVAWVVDPENHHKLAPFGSVGELLVEGPILARGYLGDPDKTNASFINDPAWLLQGAAGHPGRRGRLYKTGDLVYYGPDGNLMYVGRKDAQVKIRGKRIELGEIEHHLRACLPNSRQVAVDVISPGAGTDGTTDAADAADATLAAFLQLDQEGSDTAQEDQVTSHGMAAKPVYLPDIDQMLADHLPAHMVPSVYFTLPRLPMTISGKTDRRQLRSIGSSFSAQQLAEIRASGQGPKRLPSTDTERSIQQLWATVLNIQPSTIGLDDSFFRLGGDSITAMQLSASARALQLHFSTRDIFHRKTIAELALHVASSQSYQPAYSTKDPANTLFGLTPIQELYLDLEPSGTASYDQSVLLELRTHVSHKSLTTALQTLIQRHSMLRARFAKQDTQRWSQYIADTEDAASFALTHVQSDGAGDIRRNILAARNSLDIRRGPMMAAVLFDKDSCQSLFLAVHHLSIDLVSWRILLEELQQLLLNETLPPMTSMPFQPWQAVQAKDAAQEANGRDLKQHDLGASQLSYWGATSGSISRSPMVTEHFVLSKETTSALLGSCNNTFQTRPAELMVAALIHSFAATFNDRAPPPVFNETHGREPQDDSIDLARTIGWFTSLFPVQVSSEAHSSLLKTIRETEDNIRSYQRNGQSYFASHFASRESAQKFASVFPVELVFNYQGLYQQLEREGSLFKRLPTPKGCDPESAAEAARFSLFTVSMVIEDGCAQATLAHSGATKHQEQIRSWFQQFETVLANLPTIILSPVSSGNGPQTSPRLGPVPLDHISQSIADEYQPFTLLSTDIRRLATNGLHPFIPETSVHGIIDILPATYSQVRYLTRGIETPAMAFNYLCIEMDSKLDADAFQLSCRKLVDHFSILRTRFIQFEDTWYQVILSEFEVPVRFVKVSGPLGEEAHSLCVEDTQYVDPLEIGTAFFLIQSALSSNYKLIIRISHAQYDGVSLPIILRTLVSIYNQEHLQLTPSFSTYVSYAYNHQAESAQYWTKVLKGSQHTRIVPRLRAAPSNRSIRKAVVAERWINAPVVPEHLTMASIISSAWAMVLSRVTGAKDIVFAHIVAGRNSELSGISDIVGPCVNTIPVRAIILPEKSADELFSSVYEQYLSLTQVDSMGWDQIVRKCTDWTSGDFLDSLFTHQNINGPLEVDIAGTTAKAEWFDSPFTVPRHIEVVSLPEGDRLRLVIGGNDHIFSPDAANKLVDMFVKAVTALSADLNAPLATCLSALPELPGDN